MELTQDKIEQLRSKGLDNNTIAELAKQNGYTMPAPKTISQNQVSQLRSQGLDDAKIQSLAQQNGYELPKETGGFQSFVQAVAKPFAKVGTTLYGGLLGVEEALGVKGATQKKEKLINQGADLGYFGQVKPIGGEAFNKLQRGETSKAGFAGRAALDLLGTGAEIASYGIGAGGTASTVKAGLKGKILKGAYEGLKTGSLGGATMSFGQAIQEADAQPAETAYKTMFGGLVGGALGAPLGAIAPVVVKGVNATKRFTNLNQVNTELYNLNNSVFKPTSSKLEKWSQQGKDPIKTFTEVFGTDIPQVGKDNRFTRESINDFVQRVDSVYKPAAEGFNTILRNSPEVNSISLAEQKAISNLDKFNLTPEMKEKAIIKVQDNFNAIKRAAVKDGALLGDDSIPVYYTDQLKDKYWGATRNFGTEDATIANSVNSSIGHGFKDSIEEVIQDLNVKNYNKKLGDLIALRYYLETKVGALAGTGGKMTRLMARVAGTIAGSKGGPIGSIIGNLTGDKLAQILIDPAMQPYRWLINKKLQQLPQAEVMRLEQEANQVLIKMMQTRAENATVRGLPAPSMIKVGGVEKPYIKNQTNPIATPSPTTYESQASNVTNTHIQPLKNSESILPTTNPTTNVNTIDNIPKIVPQKAPKTQKLSPLVEEAKKYKSAEEFVKAQGTPVYHGSDAANIIEKEGFRIMPGSVNAYGDGVYTTTSLADAKGWGGVVKAYIPKDIKLAKVSSQNPYTVNTKKLISEGYGGVEVGYGDKKHIIIFDPTKIKTKSQLKDIWKQRK